MEKRNSNQVNPRYITNFDTIKLKNTTCDVIIVGAGIAGLYTALMLPAELKIMVLSKSTYKNTNSYRAQGGIACVMNLEEDSLQTHFDDTMVCGHGENDTESVRVLVGNGPKNIAQLVKLGVPFDKKENGQFSLGREGAHSSNRIMHVGDYTGKSIMENLYRQVQTRENITVQENSFVIDLLTEENRCLGVLYQIKTKKMVCFAKDTVLATGGIGRAFNRTTNADVATGDGIAMAKRAGAKLMHMSYVQYHPTVFFDAERGKEIFLVSEAVRGEGAIIRDYKGNPLMKDVHPFKDLAPRDIVSMEIFKVMKEEDKPNVFLDITMHPKEWLNARFPYIFGKCLENGYDMSCDYIPIAPMMHYFMGGINVNISGETNLLNLYACGECAHTGVHGKNRLASNSLLEAVVFGENIAEHIANNTQNHEIQPKHFENTLAKCKVVSYKMLHKLGESLNVYYMKQNRSDAAEIKKLYDDIRLGATDDQNALDLEAFNMLSITAEIIDDIILEENNNG